MDGKWKAPETNFNPNPNCKCNTIILSVQVGNIASTLFLRASGGVAYIVVPQKLQPLQYPAGQLSSTAATPALKV